MAAPARRPAGQAPAPRVSSLAAALDRLPPYPLTRPQQTAFLHRLADRLRLPRLAPADHDLLWQRIYAR